VKNFDFYNPTRIIFGKDTIPELDKHIPFGAKILMCYGGGSIKKNGVYDQVLKALDEWEIHEFGGIESNPDYDTLMKAVHLGREKGIDFILAVGGGSVIDGAKFIAAGIPLKVGDPWNVVTGDRKVKIGEAVPLGTVLTLPATSSEMNDTSVISRRVTDEKYGWRSDAVFPVFSILDPTTTYSLPEKQVRNGIVDAYVHVIEQYATYPVNGKLQDRQAEAILLTLQDVAEGALSMPPNYDSRANLMWTVTNALNRLIGKGVPTDFATHAIGHELTALYGLVHAESLAAVLPYLLWYRRDTKGEKLVQYAHRVWGIHGDGEKVIKEGLNKMTDFFHQVGMPTKLTDFGIDPQEAAERISERFSDRGTRLGERKDIRPKDVAAILKMSQ